MFLRHALDARAEELFPLIVERVHEVERDFFALDERSEFVLPLWFAD